MISAACMLFAGYLFAEAERQFHDEDWRAILGAQMEQESACNPNARSPYAAGLMQFTPETAEWAGRTICKGLGRVKITDPKWSMGCGARYMRFLYGKFPEFTKQAGNRVAASLSAYNGGRGWVNRDRRQCLRVAWCDPERWWGHVERTPDPRRARWAIKENRGYPQRILKARYSKWQRLVETLKV